MKIEVDIVNAFVDGDQGGNPAGVVVDANSLTHEQKLCIAKRVGLSETAFVSKSSIATIKLEFFTPNRQIAHCGHATIATFSRLSELGLIPSGRMSKETIDGVREIIIDGDMAYMEQKSPQYNDISLNSPSGHTVLNSLGIDPDAVTGSNFSVVNTGNSFLMVPLVGEISVRNLRPNMSLINEVSEEFDLIGYYVFSTHVENPGRHAGARMFAPRFGIEEESATGMAAGPLACYLFDRLGLKEQTLYIEQGRLMTPPSPSVIQVNLSISNNKIVQLMAGGKGRSVKTITIDI